MKMRIGLIFLILSLTSVVSLAQAPGTKPDIDPASAERMKSQGKAIKKGKPRIADDKMTCVQIQQELSKIMIGMGPEADALDKAATRAEAVIKRAEREGGVYTPGQVEQRKQWTQPPMTDLQSAATAFATANEASGGMARVKTLLELSRKKECGGDTQGIPNEIPDESGDE